MMRLSFVVFMVVFLRSSIESTALRQDRVVHAGLRPRSEIDLTTEKQVLFCAGQNKSLECVSPGSTIAIMDTFWGRLSNKICPSEDGDPTTNCASDVMTTPLLKKLCDDKVFCEIPARHTVLQTPGTVHCPGVNKYLIVNYTCIPVEHKFVLCDGETTSLQCGQGWKLNVMTALWGRTSPATCATNLGRPSRLGNCESSNSTLEALQGVCQGRRQCVVRADNMHMVQGLDHCPDVDKYALVRYRCQPNIDQVPENSIQNPTHFFNEQPLEYHPTSTILITNNTWKLHDNPTTTNTPLPPQTTARTPSNAEDNSLDGLIQDYMQSQTRASSDDTGGLPVPHDDTPPPKGQLGVPQDGSNENLQQDVALLRNILRSKKLMRVGGNAMAGIDDAAISTASSHSSQGTLSSGINGSTGTNTRKINQTTKQMDVSREELQHLAQSPDAIRIISEYMNKNKLKIHQPNLPQSLSQGNQHLQGSLSLMQNSSSQSKNNMNETGKENNLNEHHIEKLLTATVTPAMNKPHTTGQNTASRPNQLALNELLHPTAKLGGKVIGNHFYDKFLKPKQQDLENKNSPKSGGKTMDKLRKKVSALQVISDALALMTSKLDNEEGGGKRHHDSRRQGGKTFLDVPVNVRQKDIQLLQDKINKAIETTEAMGRQAALKNPALVALKLKGKVAEDVPGGTRNKVQKQERVRIDSEIKDIEDSFNSFVEKAENSGKLHDIKNQPTVSGLFEQMQNGLFKMPFANEGKTRSQAVDNSTKGAYGFEVISQEPVINIIHDNSTSTTGTNITLNNLAVEKSVLKTEQKDTHSIDSQDKTKQNKAAVKLAPKTASRAANSIANALRRQTSKATATIALRPITTFHNLQDITLGGRINNEVIKEKEKEKLYRGEDVKTLLKSIRAWPTGKPKEIQEKTDANKEHNQVKTIGKVDENTMKILRIVVQGFLEQNKSKVTRKTTSETHHRRKKQKQHSSTTLDDFVIGAKRNNDVSHPSNRLLDRDLLDMLEKQLSNSQKHGFRIENLVSDAGGKDGEEGDTVKTVPTDRANETAQNIFIIPPKPTVKPIPAPSDDPTIEVVRKFSSGANIDNLVAGLQQMIQDAKVEGENSDISTSKETPKTEQASKTSLASNPNVVEFSDSSTSGRILNSPNAEKNTKQEDSKAVTQFAGGRILEPGSAGLQQIRQETVSSIIVNPTTKSSMTATQDKTTQKVRLKLRKLVSGVKILLKALRRNSSNSNDKNSVDEKETGKKTMKNEYTDDAADDRESDDRPGVLTLKEKQNEFQEIHNNYMNYMMQPSHKAINRWYPENTYKNNYNQLPRTYHYDEQFDMNLAQQYSANPKGYSTFPANDFAGPYTSFQPQPGLYDYSQAYQDPLVKPFSEKLPKMANHALNSALKNDPIIQAVEEFSDNETKMYNEKLKGIQKRTVPNIRKEKSQNTGLKD